MMRFFTVLGILAMLSACAPMATPEDPLADLGAFRLGHNVVVASKARTGPISRAPPLPSLGLPGTGNRRQHRKPANKQVKKIAG